jgi:V/A-type H+-transporting ATPase subunit F
VERQALRFSVKVVAVGSKAFVTGFALAGVQGEYVRSSHEALEKVTTLLGSPDVGLIMLSDDVTKEIRTEIASIRSKRAVPLIYEVPAPGSKKATVEYRTLLRQILGV